MTPASAYATLFGSFALAVALILKRSKKGTATSGICLSSDQRQFSPPSSLYSQG
jgi:hypothetical protein